MTTPPVPAVAGTWTRAERARLGRRSVGVGFFFATGHSTVVLVLPVVIAIAAGAATTARIASFRAVAFTVSWLAAALIWRAEGFERRYGRTR